MYTNVTHVTVVTKKEGKKMSEVELMIGNFHVSITSRWHKPERLCDMALTVYREAIILSSNQETRMEIR